MKIESVPAANEVMWQMVCEHCRMDFNKTYRAF